MDIRISYSQSQLDNAVDFISRNHPSFTDKDEEILDTIKEYMIKLAQDPECTHLSTMGFTLIPDREFEGMDSDENVCRVEISVDPALHLINQLDEEDFQDEVINVPIKSVWSE